MPQHYESNHEKYLDLGVYKNPTLPASHVCPTHDDLHDAHNPDLHSQAYVAQS